MEKKIAIIGAGCSGLTAIKCCREEGFQVHCFEKKNDIGGLWNYSDECHPGEGSIYKNCCINTSKEMIAFSDFPVPSHFPPIMPHQLVLQYFQMYAENFKLLPHVKFNTTVERVEQSADYDKTGRWSVTYRSTDDFQSGTVHQEVYDGVLVCTGHHVYPYIPDLPGLDTFQGIKIHSHDYKISQPFESKNVLVVGMLLSFF